MDLWKGAPHSSSPHVPFRSVHYTTVYTVVCRTKVQIVINGPLTHLLGLSRQPIKSKDPLRWELNTGTVAVNPLDAGVLGLALTKSNAENPARC